MSTFFKLRLSHTVDVESRPLLLTPQLELALDFARVIRVFIRSSPSPALHHQQQVQVDRRRSVRTTLLREYVYFNHSDPIIRDMLSDVPDLNADLLSEWEESVSSYIRRAADGVWIGKLKVAADVELVTEIVCVADQEEEAAAASRD